MMDSTHLLYILLLFLVLPAYIVLSTLFWSKYYHVPRHYDEVHFARTEDGFRIALYRYRPKNPPSVYPPVLLCHGIAANHCNLDLKDNYSLARHLNEAGFDTWLVDLRGRGNSWYQGKGKARKKYNWSFDDIAASDVPAAITKVLEVTGVGKINWVGYSMGGLLMYVYLQQTGNPRVHRLVTIASGVNLGIQRGLLSLLKIARLLTIRYRLMLDKISTFFSIAAGWVNFGAITWIINPRNIHALSIRQAMVNVVSNISKGTLDQFILWARTKRFCSFDGAIDYLDGLKRIMLPVLIIGGNRDRLAPPQSIQTAYEYLGSTEKKLTIMGRENGHRADYSHVDLAFGREAPKEVYPLVEQWFKSS